VYLTVFSQSCTCALISAVPGHLWYVPADLLTPLFDLPNKQPALQALDSGRDFVSIGLPIHLGFVMPLL
jgi:hypothetical protein